MSQRKLTIVQLLPALESGGVEQTVVQLASAVAAAGHRSVVISTGGQWVETLLKQGCEHIVLPIKSKSPLTLLQVLPLRQLLVQLNADIVHAHSRVPAWLTWLAWRKLPTSVHFVTSVHGLNSVSMYSAIMTKGEVVIAVSQTVKDYLRLHYPHCPPQRIKVIYGGINHQHFYHGFKPSPEWLQQWHSQQPQLSGKKILTLAGRITRLKGHHHFLQLVKHLVEQGQPIHGLIVGGAEAKKQGYLQELQKKVIDDGLSAHISFVGQRQDMREILSQSDIIYSLTTKPETFGLAVLESLALGRPVLGWNRGGVGEIFSACFAQGAVEADNMAQLMSKTEQFLQQAPVVAPITQFSVQEMTEQHLNLYQQLVGEK